ncbi:MAG TPA: glycosyltransferase family 9 protein [Sphingobacteriaceae bacterium]
MSWKNCKKILVIRADNLGDLLMSTPAIRALKETFGAEITVLTSSMAAGAAKLIPEISSVITYDLPWVKTDQSFRTGDFFDIVQRLEAESFDAAVVFTVYSQNPLPAAMLAYLARIPKRLAYCRENPYDLLTDWFPDKEPYSVIKHQVKRDLDLVASIGAATSDDRLFLSAQDDLKPQVYEKLRMSGVIPDKPLIIVHPGVSEDKRKYPEELWIETGIKLVDQLGFQLLLTGTANEKRLTDRIRAGIGPGSFSVAGIFSLPEFILLNRLAPLVIAVNTGTIHIAAATGTPVIVLYALTNPQHAPWKVTGKVLPFDVPEKLRSRNEVIRHVYENLFLENVPMAHPEEILSAAKGILREGTSESIPELISLRSDHQDLF